MVKDKRLTGDITGATWVSIFPPGAADAVILLVNLEVDVSEPLGDSYTKINARKPGSNDSDFQGSKVLHW